MLDNCSDASGVESVNDAVNKTFVVVNVEVGVLINPA